MKLSYSDLRDFQSDPRLLYREACHHAARRAIWSWRWRVWRHHIIFMLAAVVLAFAIICGIIALGSWAAERTDREQAPAILPAAPQTSAAVPLRYNTRMELLANWNGEKWECPAGTDVYVDETDVREGREYYVYCVE